MAVALVLLIAVCCTTGDWSNKVEILQRRTNLRSRRRQTFGGGALIEPEECDD